MSHYTPTTPVVSVLMAAMNAERTVRRAVESIQNQTLRNIELVVVDEGSDDSTLRLVESIADRDLRVEVIRSGRCGRREALDLALVRSHGSYVAVVDADGWARPTMLADMVSLAEGKTLDLVVGGYSLMLAVPGDSSHESSVEDEGGLYLTQHEFRAAAWRLFGTGQMLPASAKLFSRERIEEWGTRFSSGINVESDHAFVMGYLKDVERVGVLPGVCYRVDRRGAATPAADRYRTLEAEHRSLLNLYRYWGLEGDAASMEMLQSRYVERLVDCIEDVCGVGSPLSGAEQRRRVSQMLGTDQARLATSVARPRSAQARSLLMPIRSKNVALVCVQARLLSLLHGGRVAETSPDAIV